MMCSARDCIASLLTERGYTLLDIDMQKNTVSLSRCGVEFWLWAPVTAEILTDRDAPLLASAIADAADKFIDGAKDG